MTKIRIAVSWALLGLGCVFLVIWAWTVVEWFLNHRETREALDAWSAANDRLEATTVLTPEWDEAWALSDNCGDTANNLIARGNDLAAHCVLLWLPIFVCSVAARAVRP